MTDNPKLSPFPLESGQPFTVPGDLLPALDAELAAPVDQRKRAPFIDGSVAGEWLIAAGAAAELPDEWTVHEADGKGSVTSSTYRLGWSAGHPIGDPPQMGGWDYIGPCYWLHGADRTESAQDSTISPTLGQRFQQAAAEHVGVNAELGALVAEPEPEPEPEPAGYQPGDLTDQMLRSAIRQAQARAAAGPTRRWLVCSTCKGHGSLVDVASTEQLRIAGHPSTVTNPCGPCQGSGGMVVEQAADS